MTKADPVPPEQDPSSAKPLDRDRIWKALLWLQTTVTLYTKCPKPKTLGFPSGPVVKNPPCDARDTGQSLVQEDPTCLRETKPMHHHY